MIARNTADDLLAGTQEALGHEDEVACSVPHYCLGFEDIAFLDCFVLLLTLSLDGREVVDVVEGATEITQLTGEVLHDRVGF